MLRELSVNPRSGMPDGGLAISRLRSLRSLKAEARRALDRYRKPLASPIGYEPPLGARSPAMREPSPGRRRDERDYAELAIGYEALIREGSNEPVSSLPGGYGFTRPQMRDLLHRARVLGFLTPPPGTECAAGPRPRRPMRSWRKRQASQPIRRGSRKV